MQASLQSERSPCLGCAGDEFHLACVIIDETDDLRPYYRERPLVRCNAGCATRECVHARQPESCITKQCSASVHAGTVQQAVYRADGACGCRGLVWLCSVRSFVKHRIAFSFSSSSRGSHQLLAEAYVEASK